MNKVGSLPLVSIIIPVVGYQKLPDYLVRSLLSLDYPRKKMEILLIKTTSQTMKVTLGGLHTSFVEGQAPMGYGQAANLGAKKSQGKYFFLINPDIKIEQHALKEMTLYLLQNPRVGIVGPKVYSLSFPDQVSPFDLPGMGFSEKWGRITPVYTKQIDELEFPQEVDWVSGCAMLFARDAWEKLAGFDERYFIYWEDADVCLRAKKIGRATILLPKAQAWHATSAFMGKISPLKIYYLAKNTRFFIDQHSGFGGKFLLHTSNVLSVLAKMIRLILSARGKEESRSFLTGVLDFYLGRTGVTTRSL